MWNKIFNFFNRPLVSYLILTILLVISILLVGLLVYEHSQNNLSNIDSNNLQTKIASFSSELKKLKADDQYKINQQLKSEIDNINKTYQKATKSYENLADLKLQNSKLDKKFDQTIALALKQLSDKNYASADATLTELDKNIKAENDKLASIVNTNSTAKDSANIATNNTPPSLGYNLQNVQTDTGTFKVSIISADLNSTKVIVDTASDSDCSNNCPTLSLADYVSRNGAFAGINGSFFCPAEYPSCAGKTNSFDTLVMNKNKHYFNSDNNIYSVVPAAIFRSGSARFVGQTQEWGRDTSVDAVIANYPLYIAGGNINFGGSGDSKIDNKGTRTFIANKGNTVYIGIIYNASGSDSAHVLKTLGVDSALGLDQGGSTALWFGGYKAGPGRSLPNAVLFIKR